jgi:hypothetical protein
VRARQPPLINRGVAEVTHSGPLGTCRPPADSPTIADAADNCLVGVVMTGVCAWYNWMREHMLYHSFSFPRFTCLLQLWARPRVDDLKMTSGVEALCYVIAISIPIAVYTINHVRCQMGVELSVDVGDSRLDD